MIALVLYYLLICQQQISQQSKEKRREKRMRKTNINHFEPFGDEMFSVSSENQFLASPSKLTYDEKDELIKKLQAKNQLLQNEVRKINEVLQEPERKTRYGIKLPQSKEATTNQQLENAYKQIRQYEYEIKKVRSLGEEGSYVLQIKKLEGIFKQKEELSGKLKRYLAEIKKKSSDLTKDLKDNQKKQYYDQKHDILSSEIKFLRGKVKELEDRRDINQANFDKQKLFIKELEKSVLQHGMDYTSLRAIKEKFRTRDRPPSSRYGTIHETQTNRGSRATSTLEPIHNRSYYVDNRTFEGFKYLKDEMRLLKKMEKDYENKITTLELEAGESNVLFLRSKNKLNQIEGEIEQVELTIETMKTMIDPKKLKPLQSFALQAQRQTGSVGRYGDVNKSLSSIDVKSFNHLHKSLEVGKYSRNGKKFDDRQKIGKNPAKIVGIDLYENRGGNGNVVGIQTTYEIKQVLKKSPLNMIHDIDNADKKSFNLFDNEDYFKQIECVCNEKGLIIGICLKSVKGIIRRAGPPMGNLRKINLKEKEYPTCFYGSFNSEGIELFGCEVLSETKK